MQTISIETAAATIGRSVAELERAILEHGFLIPGRINEEMFSLLAEVFADEHAVEPAVEHFADTPELAVEPAEPTAFPLGRMPSRSALGQWRCNET